MVVVDISALIAILLLEPEAERFARTIAEARPRLISTANPFEAGIAIEGRPGVEAGADLDDSVTDVGLEIEPVTGGSGAPHSPSPSHLTAEAIIRPD